MCRDKTKILHFSFNSHSGKGVRNTTGDTMVFSLVLGSSLMVGVGG